jgi:enoyl-CoA hydratase/carnithine racemase
VSAQLAESETPEPAAVGERRGAVAIIRLNRPAALNSVNAAPSTAVGELLEQAAVDDKVRVVVLTGTGRAFCAGADLKAVAAGESLDAPEHPEWGFAGYARHWIDKPTIAAVNGFVLGGGRLSVIVIVGYIGVQRDQASSARIPRVLAVLAFAAFLDVR